MALDAQCRLSDGLFVGAFHRYWSLTQSFGRKTGKVYEIPECQEKIAQRRTASERRFVPKKMKRESPNERRPPKKRRYSLALNGKIDLCGSIFLICERCAHAVASRARIESSSEEASTSFVRPHLLEQGSIPVAENGLEASERSVHDVFDHKRKAAERAPLKGVGAVAIEVRTGIKKARLDSGTEIPAYARSLWVGNEKNKARAI